MATPSAPVAGATVAPVDAAAQWRRAARSLAPSRILIQATEITHPDAISPLRAVNDGRGWAIEGNPYSETRLQWSLADDVDAPPQGELSLDNTGGVATQWIEQTNGAYGAIARLLQVSVEAAAPDVGTIEWEQSLRILAADANRRLAVFRLGVPSLRGRPAVLARYGPAQAPGLF